MEKFSTKFSRISSCVTAFTGSPKAFIIAVTTLIIWLLAGPLFLWSEMHSLFINTFTTIVTFLMVFLIQHSQNRDQAALHKKIDELIRSIDKADDKLIGIEQKIEDDDNIGDTTTA